MIIANFEKYKTEINVYGLDQYDYGQQLELHGLSLPKAVEVHFAVDKSTADAERRVGITKDGVTTVAIPDKMLEQSRPIVAYVYVTDAVSGKTVRKVTMPINPRQKPQDFVSPDDPLKDDPFRDAVMAVSDAAERAKTSEKSAEAWTHGSTDYPERDMDNARYYAEQAKEAYGQISDDAKKQIDEYIKRKEDELKGDPGNDGITPHIGENGNWYIGDTDTGINAHGIPGNDGITPHIGENGNWYIGDVDTGMASKGADGQDGSDGKSAYQYAQEGGYTGTESKFADKLAKEIPDKLPNPQKLIFSGAVTAEYDGSGSVMVTIPEGSGGSGGTVRIEKLSTDTTVELEANKLYIFPEMVELTITLSEPTDIGIANEYHFVFQSGATATTLSIPDTVKLPSNFSVDASKIYEISILEGCLCVQSWAVR